MVDRAAGRLPVRQQPVRMTISSSGVGLVAASPDSAPDVPVRIQQAGGLRGGLKTSGETAPRTSSRTPRRGFPSAGAGRSATEHSPGRGAEGSRSVMHTL